MVLRKPLNQTSVDRRVGRLEVHFSVGDDPRLGIDVQLQPLSDNVGFGIGQPDVPGGNHDTWQRLDGHVVGGEVHRPLIDHDGPVRLVDVLFLKIVDAFGFYVERRGSGTGLTRRSGRGRQRRHR